MKALKDEQAEVLRLVANGCSIKEAANKVGVTPSTVSDWRRHRGSRTDTKYADLLDKAKADGRVKRLNRERGKDIEGIIAAVSLGHLCKRECAKRGIKYQLFAAWLRHLPTYREAYIEAVQRGAQLRRFRARNPRFDEWETQTSAEAVAVLTEACNNGISRSGVYYAICPECRHLTMVAPIARTSAVKVMAAVLRGHHVTIDRAEDVYGFMSVWTQAAFGCICKNGGGA